jgi:hypothetical protein
MMDVDGYYQYRMEHYHSILREAEQDRLAQELGVTETGILRSVVADFQQWLSHVTSPLIASNHPESASPSSNEPFPAPRTRYGG